MAKGWWIIKGLILQFHLDNAKERSLQRLKEQRPKPIDFIVRDLLLGDSIPPGTDPPYQIFQDLNLAEVHALREDILEYQVRL